MLSSRSVCGTRRSRPTSWANCGGAGERFSSTARTPKTIKMPSRGRRRLGLIVLAITPLVLRRCSGAWGQSVGGACTPPQQGTANAERRDEQIHQAEIDEFPELPRASTRFADGAIDLLFTAHVNNVIPER